MSDPLELWYREPARAWIEAQPVGNGHLGAMVFGDPYRERIALNDVTLWSGGRFQQAPEAADVMPELRRAVLAGDYATADELVKRQQGPWTQAYMPMGDLWLDFGEDHASANVENYRRSLDLDSAVQTTRYTVNGVSHTRDVFASAYENALVMHLTADQAGQITFTARLSTQLGFAKVYADQIFPDDKNKALILVGKAPRNAMPNYRGGALTYADTAEGEGLNFLVCLRALPKALPSASMTKGCI